MEDIYSLITQSKLLILNEPSAAYECISERHLHAMWFEQKYFKQLNTSDGNIIEVLSPGIWNAETGPDFYKAHLKINGVEYRGDIEMHFSDDQWEQHNHHHDARYNNVILHISMWKPRHQKQIIKENGNIAFQTYFEDSLTITFKRIMHLIDLDLYPYKRFIGSGKCAHSLFKRLPEQEIASFFQSASLCRLTKKKEFLETHCKESLNQLFAGFSMALGYKQNAIAFLTLFKALLNLKSQHEELLIAQCMQACGYFEEPFLTKWKHSTKYQKLQTLCYPWDVKVNLRHNQIRPLNNPLRRIVLLAKVLSDPNPTFSYEYLIQLWESNWLLFDKKKRFKQFISKMLELLPNYSDSYWNHHYNFETEPTTKVLPLLGADTKREIIVNTFFPILYHHILQQNDALQLSAFVKLFNSIPAANAGKTKYLQHRFFGDSEKGQIFKRVDLEQGAYQLHHDFCQYYEASCEGCSFVETYNKLLTIPQNSASLHENGGVYDRSCRTATNNRSIKITRNS